MTDLELAQAYASVTRDFIVATPFVLPILTVFAFFLGYYIFARLVRWEWENYKWRSFCYWTLHQRAQSLPVAELKKVPRHDRPRYMQDYNEAIAQEGMTKFFVLFRIFLGHDTIVAFALRRCFADACILLALLVPSYVALRIYPLPAPWFLSASVVLNLLSSFFRLTSLRNDFIDATKSRSSDRSSDYKYQRGTYFFLSFLLGKVFFVLLLAMLAISIRALYPELLSPLGLL